MRTPKVARLQDETEERSLCISHCLPAVAGSAASRTPSELECDASSHRFQCCTLTFAAVRESASALIKTKQPPRDFARRLPLELYPGDVDFSTTLPVTVLSILYHPGCRLDHFNLGTHSLDLGGLLFELGCESLYLFLLLRDYYFQRLNFANLPAWCMAGRVGALGAV